MTRKGEVFVGMKTSKTHLTLEKGCVKNVGALVL